MQRVYDEDTTVQQNSTEEQVEQPEEISTNTAEEQRAIAQKEMQELQPKFIAAMREGLDVVASLHLEDDFADAFDDADAENDDYDYTDGTDDELERERKMDRQGESESDGNDEDEDKEEDENENENENEDENENADNKKKSKDKKETSQVQRAEKDDKTTSAVVVQVSPVHHWNDRL